MKEYWVNVYKDDLENCFDYFHHSRQSAEHCKSQFRELAYRIHVRMK